MWPGEPKFGAIAVSLGSVKASSELPVGIHPENAPILRPFAGEGELAGEAAVAAGESAQERIGDAMASDGARRLC